MLLDNENYMRPTEQGANPILHIFGFLKPLVRAVMVYAKYRSKADIIGFSNLPSNHPTLLVTRNE